MRAFARLRRRYENASLQRKIALVMAIGGLLVTATMAFAAYLLSRQLIVANIQSTLGLHAQQKEREIFLRVDAALALARSLADNTVTANALADNLGRHTYLNPLFRAQNLPFPGARLTLTDYRARPVAGNAGEPEQLPAELAVLVAETLRGGAPQALLQMPADLTQAAIVATFPVIYRLSGQAEGCVLLEIPLAELLPEASSKYKYAILDGEGRPIAGLPSHAEAIEAEQAIVLPGPFAPIHLLARISQERGLALQALDRLLLVFVAISGLLLIAVTVISRAAARFLSAPLSELAAAADRISRSGRPDAILEVQRDDEFGRLARGFQTMLKRLADSYGELECRVEERTRALQASEQKLSSILASLLDAVWSLAPDGRRITYVSPAMAGMTGLTIDDFGDQLSGFFAAVHDDDLPILRAAVAALIDCQQPVDIEFRFRHPHKGLRVLQCRAQALLDEAGRPMRFDGILTDVTLRVVAERRLQHRTDQLNAIFALSPDGFVAFGDTGSIEYASPAFTEMTGLGTPEVGGLNEEQLLDRLAELSTATRTSQLTLATLRASSKPDERQRLLLEIRRPQPRTLEIGRRWSEGRKVSKIFYFRDVTHETEVDRLKSEFLSTAAHELRTPMVSILGFSELLLNDTGFDADTERELLTTIHRQSALMAAIIDELLDLARIEARRGQDFVIEPIDLGELLRETCRAFKAPEDERRIGTELAGLAASIHGDRRKITQAVTNVLSNAFKYSPDGGPITLALAACERQERPGFRIAVRDCGIGMSAESLARICERFFRADTSGRILGTGLGMSIVKEIVELHGGGLDISSQPGRGTEVALWLPENAPAPFPIRNTEAPSP